MAVNLKHPPNKTKNAANDGFAFRFIEGI